MGVKEQGARREAAIKGVVREWVDLDTAELMAEPNYSRAMYEIQGLAALGMTARWRYGLDRWIKGLQDAEEYGGVNDTDSFEVTQWKERKFKDALMNGALFAAFAAY